MDINDLRGLATVLCMIGFFAVVWWAYGPSRRKHFEEAGRLPFDDDDQETGAAPPANSSTHHDSARKRGNQ